MALQAGAPTAAAGPALPALVAALVDVLASARLAPEVFARTAADRILESHGDRGLPRRHYLV